MGVPAYYVGQWPMPNITLVSLFLSGCWFCSSKKNTDEIKIFLPFKHVNF
jgi:hypothetical protein